jgi:predicted RNase H-like HicB family nuclease
MTCPPEIASILLEMMTHGFVRIRNWANDPARCLALSDHLHNLPDLVRDFSTAKLSYYWNVERLCFIRQSVEADRAAFEPLWEELRCHVESKGSAERTGYLVVIEKAGEGSYHAFVPDLPGCVSNAGSPWEAAIEIREAMTWHLESLRRHNEPVPPPSATGQFVMIYPP